MAANQQSSSLLWVHLFEPHIAYEPPKRHVPQTELVARYGSRFNSSRKKDVRDGNIMRLAEEREWMRSLYDGEVSYEDEIVGVFLDRLKELGVYEDALIIFLSDHGEEFWEHGHWEHGQSLYNELVNVPLLIKLPQGSLMEVGASVSTAGVFATLADYYGLEQPAEENMVPSFKHLLTKQQGEGSSRTVPPVFLGGVEYFGPRQAVVWDGWKYIQHEDPTAAELYRYVEDPLELNSVIVQYPEIAAHGKMLLEQHYAAFPIITQSVEGSGISSNVASMIQEMGYTD
jgi:arylsulfatase A-like enzyme